MWATPGPPVRLRSAAFTYRGWVQGPVTMPVLLFGFRWPARLDGLVAGGAGLDEGGDLVVQLPCPCNVACAGSTATCPPSLLLPGSRSWVRRPRDEAHAIHALAPQGMRHPPSSREGFP